MNSRIKGNTKLYGVIGDPIAHSLSPEIHNSIFDRYHANCIYIPLHIQSPNLQPSIALLRNAFEGFNVTIPHKQQIIPYLDEIDEQAVRYGAVNTVKIRNGKLTGYNTDGYGFMKSLEMEGIHVEGRQILLVGAGGAARVAAYELLKKGAVLTVANRNVEKAQVLKEELCLNMSIDGIEVCDIREIDRKYWGIVNTTPVGMHPKIGEMPIHEKVLEGVNFVYDMIYNPYQTKLLKTAEKYGCRCINGFAMLFYQAVKAQEIWMGKTLSKEMIKDVYKEIENYFYGCEHTTTAIKESRVIK